MITYFKGGKTSIYGVQHGSSFNDQDNEKLLWLFGASLNMGNHINGRFIGPRSAMITPWSTNAVEITQNMGIKGILRIEQFVLAETQDHDPMTSQVYDQLDQEIFDINITPEPIINIKDIAAYNEKEGLALSKEEVEYLEKLSQKLGRPLTDSEVFGFSQVNSEHCRHKIFNGTFIIDGEEQAASLFQLIKKTSKVHPNTIISAYKDNVAFVEGPSAIQFAPEKADIPSQYVKSSFDSVISIKAETHNFPTTVEPFSGAATGSGGEIRDRLAGGKGSIPLAGTALYMTPYSRLTSSRNWENGMPERKWLYQTPIDILIKASNGASDFGNKFGQPLINGSVLTFEHHELGTKFGFDKVIMMAGGIGYARKNQALKGVPQSGDKIVILGGDNYRIGMGGAAVSSADGGSYNTGIELNAVQRSNPEMQKRAANTIRALVEAKTNPIVSIHDHGAGGHLNCLSELVEDTGGIINLDALPVGDPTLSDKEIIGNESQERMGLIINPSDQQLLQNIAERERSPMFVVGEVTDNQKFSIQSQSRSSTPMDLNLSDMFGSSPQTILSDQANQRQFSVVKYDFVNITSYIQSVLRLEAVACKDWLTNKVDRCVGGKVAKQQCAGPLQLPLNNCGVMAIDYDNLDGIATSMGHAPVLGLIDPGKGSRIAITEALTNIIWAPLKDGIKSISLSANWMWPAKNEGENARLYAAVKAVSDFAIELGINIPTGKDSMSMKQKYPNETVFAPGTVVISAVGHVSDITKTVEPVLKHKGGHLYYINLSQQDYVLGGSSLAQILNKIGSEGPDIKDAKYIVKTFNAIQKLIVDDHISAGHDISAGGLVTALLELCFSDNNIGIDVDLSKLDAVDTTRLLLAENPGILLQSTSDLTAILASQDIVCHQIGTITQSDALSIINHSDKLELGISEHRDIWYETSYLLDQRQSGEIKAKERFQNYKSQPLKYKFPTHHTGQLPDIENLKARPKAAVLREKGSNSERELAHAMYLAGFDVRDVHMTDLISGRETLEDIKFIGAVGGFSNSDVLGSAKGWAGAFKYNPKAKAALESFFAQPDVLSVGICNGCQLWLELDLLYQDLSTPSKMLHNDSGKHECDFTSVTIEENNSVMLSSLAGSTLGVWISHGEGKFHLPMPENHYNIVAKYGYDSYPANPNGSDYNAAMICSPDGRHLAMMPHIERSIFKWNWAHYNDKRQSDVISPWIDAFVNARNWILNNKK